MPNSIYHGWPLLHFYFIHVTVWNLGFSVSFLLSLSYQAVSIACYFAVFHYSVFFVVAINLEQTKTSQDATQAEIKYQKLLHGLRTAGSAVKAYISGMYYKQDVCWKQSRPIII